jgi:hypothetical protein
MRLARTAPPLPRKSGRQESNLRSPVPETGGVACSPTARRRSSSTPGGTRTRASGLRTRRHRRFDHGGMQLRRQGSNLPLAINSRASYRLDHAGTKTEAAGLEPANGSDAVYAVATRCLSSSAMPPRAEGEGVEPPRPKPTRFRDGIPRRWQSFRRWPRQASNLHRPG